MIKVWKLWKLKKQIEDEKKQHFSASSKNMKFRTYKLQTMLKTFIQKFFEYFRYFIRYDLPSMNGQNLIKSDLTGTISGAPTEYVFFCVKCAVKFVSKFDYK